MANLGQHLTQGVHGFGTGSQTELDNLRKALTTGYAIGAGRTDGPALRVESLEASLKVVTYSGSHLKFWKKIPKSTAYSTNEEYNQVLSYGGFNGAFLKEGEAPQSTDSNYVRKSQLMKFIGTQREVTQVATVVNPAHGDIVTQYNKEGILWMLEQIETKLFTGDETLAFNGQSEEWDGMDNMIDPTSTIDLKGGPLTEIDLEEGSNTILENYGFATDLLYSTRAHSDLTKQFYPRQRIALPAPVNGKVGMNISEVDTAAGPLALNPNVFIRPAPTPRATATSGLAPATPTSIVAGAATGTTGDHNKGAASGVSTNFNYVVTACNRFGESAPTAVQGAVVTLTAVNKDAGAYIPLTITNAASVGSQLPEYFRIYRSNAKTAAGVPASLSAYSLIAQVPASSQANSGTTVFNDLNLYLPFTSSAYLGEMTSSVLTFRQLMPLMKMDLAVLGPSYRWMLLLYGAPIMFANKKWLRFINVGASVTVR